MKKISMDKINRFILRKQHLSDDSKIDDIVKIVKDISGLHATGATTPYLSLFDRARNFKKENLDAELYVRRNLGKIRCMRKTLYILTREMIPVAYAATNKMVEKMSRQYLEFRGVSIGKYERASKSILDILRGSELTASEIKKALKTKLNISATINLMCDRGLLIRSRPEKGWRDRNQRYALFKEYLPDISLTEINEEEARKILVQQYLCSFAPVTENDIVWWTGLNKTQVNQALSKIQDQIVRVRITNLKGNFLMLSSDEEFPGAEDLQKSTVNMLPALDPYIMGYKERDRYINTEHYDDVFDRSGNSTSTILFDGKVVGVWDYAEDAEPTVKLFLFEEVNRSALREIHLKAKHTGKFMADKEVKIKECDSMTPLTHRTAGGFMSPLEDC